MTNISSDSNQDTSGPSILGIWRLGEAIHTGRKAELTLAQPADADGSPRWDYVIKRALMERDSIENVRDIVQFSSAASAASHPNLVPVLDASVTGSSPYLVMPRLEGPTMAELMAQQIKPLPVALWLARQTAQGLSALHSVGWIHGDVKPENIIVGSNGHVTVIDLGFATKIHTASRNQFRGTPEYAAPEMLTENMAALPAADIFSLGRVLWKWLTKIEPASESSLEPVAELIQQMVSDEPGERPTATFVTQQLLRLEIETLGQHMGPRLRAA